MVDYSLGLSVDVVRMSIKGLKSYSLVNKFFQDKLLTQGFLGKGLMKYQGRFSAENSVFLGENKKLDVQILVFSGELGMTELELFRKDFLNVDTNKAI